MHSSFRCIQGARLDGLRALPSLPKVRTQFGVTASAGPRRGDVEIRDYLRDQAGSRSLVIDLSVMHERFGSSSHRQQHGLLTGSAAPRHAFAYCCTAQDKYL
jgi:hypothetical protein